MILGKDGIVLGYAKKLDTRTVLRITLIRNYNDKKRNDSSICRNV